MSWGSFWFVVSCDAGSGEPWVFSAGRHLLSSVGKSAGKTAIKRASSTGNWSSSCDGRTLGWWGIGHVCQVLVEHFLSSLFMTLCGVSFAFGDFISDPWFL